MATDAFYAPGDNGRDVRTIAQLCGHVVFRGMLPCNRDKRLVVTYGTRSLDSDALRRVEPMQTDLPYRRIGNHALLAVRLTPKAKEDVILGIEQFGSKRVLKARVRAVPQQGCANEALERLIAKWLGLPPSSVAVVQGGKSRMKYVKISGDGDRLVRLLAERVASLAGSV